MIQQNQGSKLPSMLFRRIAYCPIVLTLLGLCLIVTGCASPDSSIGSIRVEAGDYDTAFDIAIETLRNERFRLDRVDRRSGVITTQPRNASSIAEPWQGDHATTSQATEATLHHQRRVVSVAFIPLPGETVEATRLSSTPSLSAIDEMDSTTPIGEFNRPVRIMVQCWIERAHRPGQRIETSSLRHSSNTIDPTLQSRGIPSLFWERISRDSYMEQRIINSIATEGKDVVVVSIRETDRRE